MASFIFSRFNGSPERYSTIEYIKLSFQQLSTGPKGSVTSHDGGTYSATVKNGFISDINREFSTNAFNASKLSICFAASKRMPSMRYSNIQNLIESRTNSNAGLIPSFSS